MPKPIQYLIWTFKDFSKDNGPQWAAALTYYALMSVFPLMLAALSIATLFVSLDTAVSQASSLAQTYLPSGQDQIRGMVEAIFKQRGQASAISIILLLWSGSGIFAVLRLALNIAFDQDENLNFIKMALFRLAMALTLGVLLLLALLSATALGLLWQILSLGPQFNVLLGFLQYAVQGLLLLVVFYLSYRFVPREQVHSRPAWIGASIATVLFLILRPAFSFYVSHFANYSQVYGALATLVILVFYAYLSAMIFLLGGELTSLIEGLEYQGKSREKIEQQHEARAPVRQVKEAAGETS